MQASLAYFSQDLLGATEAVLGSSWHPVKGGGSHFSYIFQYTFSLENKGRGRCCCLSKHIHLIPFPGLLVTFLTAVIKYLAKLASGGKVLLQLMVLEGIVQYSQDSLALMLLECASGPPYGRPGRNTARNMAEIQASGLPSRDPHFLHQALPPKTFTASQKSSNGYMLYLNNFT